MIKCLIFDWHDFKKLIDYVVGRKVSEIWFLFLYIGLIIKCEWYEFVECIVHLPNIAKVKWDIY